MLQVPLELQWQHDSINIKVDCGTPYTIQADQYHLKCCVRGGLSCIICFMFFFNFCYKFISIPPCHYSRAFMTLQAVLHIELLIELRLH